MDNKNKKIFSTILLVVGVLFIVVSGGIFVSKTWQYLPEIVKKLCLIAVTGGFFVGSYFAKENSLNKTGTALFYLGVCFTGFSMMALLSSLSMEMEWKRALSLLAMAVPVGIHFYRDRNPIDLVIEIFLCDGMLVLLSGFGEYRLGSKVATLCFSVYTMALAALIYYCRKNGAELEAKRNEDEEARDGRIMLVISCVAFALHLQGCIPCTLIHLFSRQSFFFGLFPILMLVAAVTVVWLAFDKPLILRLVHSAFLVYGAFGISVFFLQEHFAMMIFFAFLIILIMMVALDRQELIIAGIGLAGLATMVQVILYAVNGFGMEMDRFAYPYGICMGIAILIWKYFTKYDISWKQVGKIAAVFALMSVDAIFASGIETYAVNYAVAFFLALGWLLLSCFVDVVGKLEVVEKAFQTGALVFGLIPLACNPIITPVIYGADGMSVIADFNAEYRIIFMGLGIVLLGIIWYDIFEKIRFVQFVGTCLLLMVLIMHNLACPALPNVLFLGIGALTMLIVATLMKRKNYAIAAAATLILVALYLTKELWLSIAWWVYLFVAGIGLVIFAIKKEKAEN